MECENALPAHSTASYPIKSCEKNSQAPTPARKSQLTMIEIRETQAGCQFAVRVTPKAKKRALGGTHDGALKIAVTAPPEDGKANAAVIQAIAKWLCIAKSNVDITAGQTSRIKTIHVTGIDQATLRSALP